MVVKISPPAESVTRSFNYNEFKVENGVATILYMNKIDDPNNPLDTLIRYENGRKRCTKPSFHMSVNPGKNDNMTDEKIVAFTRELMAGLGYGDQPVIIFRHNDIDREHYHVVSVRVDANGKKINDSKEHIRCQKLLEKLAKKYGFTIGNGKEKKPAEHVPDPYRDMKAFDQWLEKNPPPDFLPEDAELVEDPRVIYQRFNKSDGNVKKQIEDIVKQAMKYHFTSIEQYQKLMRHFGVAVDLPKSVRKIYLTYAGIDLHTGKRCTEPIPEKRLEVPNIEAIVNHMEKARSVDKSAEEERMVRIVAKSLVDGKDKREVNALLMKKNISMIVSKGKDGHVENVFYIDHAKHTVFSGDLKGLPVSAVEKVRSEVWEKGKDERGRLTPSEKDSVLRETAMAVLDALGYHKSRKHEDDRYGPRKKRIGPGRR